MANVDPIKPIKGKKLIWICAIGSVVFTLVMLFGTYFMAKVVTHFLQKQAPPPVVRQSPHASS